MNKECVQEKQKVLETVLNYLFECYQEAESGYAVKRYIFDDDVDKMCESSFCDGYRTACWELYMKAKRFASELEKGKV